jgi:hypothetical protein
MGQTAEPITVIFVCQGCLAPYKATQAHAPSKGCFRCEDCRHPIHHWDGAYNYTRWRQFDPSQDD